MHIAYIGKHGSGGGDDEGAIAHSLQLLGHTVSLYPERKVPKIPRNCKPDFLLLHHYPNPELLTTLPYPKVFWCFDRIYDPEPSLNPRSTQRMSWAQAMESVCDFSFYTDGDWALASENRKWLTQGADPRLAIDLPSREALNPRLSRNLRPRIPLLLTATRRGGELRESFVKDLTSRYGRYFFHYEQGLYGYNLRSTIADTCIVLAPDSPISSRYCSNRVYTSLGLRAFLLHPYCEHIALQYTDGEHLVFYRDRDHLYSLISEYLDDHTRRDIISEAGHRHTLRHHLYTNRVSRLIDVVRDL